MCEVVLNLSLKIIATELLYKVPASTDCLCSERKFSKDELHLTRQQISELETAFHKVEMELHQQP